MNENFAKKRKMEEEMRKFEMELGGSSNNSEPAAKKPKPTHHFQPKEHAMSAPMFIPHQFHHRSMPAMMPHFQPPQHFVPPQFQPQMMSSIFAGAPIEVTRNPQSWDPPIAPVGPSVYSAPPIRNITKPKPKAMVKPDYTPVRPSAMMMKEKTPSIPATANMDLYKYVGPIDRKNKKNKMIRLAGGKTWEDNSLLEWDPNDFRIFCGDLGNEVTDEVLARAFNKYPSFVKSKVIRDKKSNKTKGYGFVSFKDPQDFIRAMREMNGKFVGSRPIKLRKSCWKDRDIDAVKKRQKEKQKLGLL